MRDQYINHLEALSLDDLNDELDFWRNEVTLLTAYNRKEPDDRQIRRDLAEARGIMNDVTNVISRAEGNHPEF